ncbi:MAG: threonine synthase [Gemmatimonadota bacterium]
MSTTIDAGVQSLECTYCGKTYTDTERRMRLSPCCEKPLYARYALDRIAEDFRPERVAGRTPTMWRYAEVLPVHDPAYRITLGEGFTPMLDAPRLAAALGVRKVWVKDEGQNPTGSFKARGLGMAVARAAEQGVEELCIPSAGNAGSAAAAYAAAAGLPVHIAVPEDTPRPIVQEIRALGADLQLVKGLITDAGARIAAGAREHGWFDLSTLKEPYRVEGKKTMGYEVFEQLGNRLPDVIVYPTGGGTGMVGMWKAFDEMERMGWIGSERPRMVSVQGTGCAPIVRAWQDGVEHATPWENAHTVAVGLKVPQAVGDFLILRAIRESGGAAVAGEDDAMVAAVALLGRTTGVFASPEGGATAAAIAPLLASGHVRPEDEVVLFNTGSGLKYTD